MHFTKNLTILFFIAIPFSSTIGQSFSLKYFESTIWASSAQNNKLLNTDTIKLVRIYDDPYNEKDKSMNVHSYFNDSNYIILKFLKKGKLIFSESKIADWVITTIKEKSRWSYDTNKQILSLYIKGDLIGSYIPIPGSETNKEIESNYKGKSPIKTIEISLKKVKQ